MVPLLILVVMLRQLSRYPAATASAAQCAATTAALSTFVINSPGQIGGTLGPYSPTTCDGSQYQVRNQKILVLKQGSQVTLMALCNGKQEFTILI